MEISGIELLTSLNAIQALSQLSYTPTYNFVIMGCIFSIKYVNLCDFG